MDGPPAKPNPRFQAAGAGPWRLTAAASRISPSLAVALAAATALSLLAREGWLPDLLTFARQHLAVAAVLIAIVAARSRRWTWSLVALGTAAVNVALLYPDGPARLAWAAPGAAASSPRLRVLSLNLTADNYYTGRVSRFLRKSGADILAFQEISPYWGVKLEELRDAYPYVFPPLVPFSSEIAVMSRRPLVEAEILAPPPGSVAADWARPLRVVVGDGAGGRVTVYDVHPETPRSRDRWRMRNEQLAWLARTARERDGDRPRVVAGDFNAPPSSPFLQDLARVADLRDAAGSGFRWPTRQPTPGAPYLFWLGAPVDHILVSPGIAVEGFAVERNVESDHRPIVADLRLPAAPPSPQPSAASPAR